MLGDDTYYHGYVSHSFSYDVIEDYNMHIQTIGKEVGNHRVSVLSCVVFPLLILEFSESC